ncbi:MAG: neutral zinc metallopeptidase, partial [Bryobacteraceae bacterium]
MGLVAILKIDATRAGAGAWESLVLDDAQRNWDEILPRDAGVRYRHAKLVLFRDAYPSGCGMAQDATGGAQKVLGIEPEVQAPQQQRPNQANQGIHRAAQAHRYRRWPVGPQRRCGRRRRSH